MVNVLSSSPSAVRPRICLNMIVKNESAVIERCLDSVLPLIDTWVIVDTGSSDDTMGLIKAKLAHLPGELHERPWVNFGHNRSEAVALAQHAADYVLFFDADDVLVRANDFVLPTLTADAYQLWLEEGGIRYTRTLLVSTRLKWQWVGVVHEYPLAQPAPSKMPPDALAGLTVKSGRGGARSADPKRYLQDAALLEAALKINPSDARSMFYLAQSYRDAGEKHKAFDAYLRRADMEGWEEERWHALWQAARLAEQLKRPWSETSDRYLSAFQARPVRAEPLVDLARAERERSQHARAFVYALTASKISRPASDILFVDESVYGWRALDELAVAAYWTDRHELSRDVCTALLAGSLLPSDQRSRVQANLEFALAKLGSNQSGGAHSQFFATQLHSGDLVFDIGANHGEFSQAFLDIGARVVAVEPNEKLVNLLREKFERELANGNMVIVDCALGASPGKANLSICAQDKMSSLSPDFISTSKANGDRWNPGTQAVAVTTLDNLIAAHGRPRFCKIDVEGYDFEVLSGLSESLEIISFEYNTQAALIGIARNCLQRVSALALYEFNYVRLNQAKFELEKWADAAQMLNLLDHILSREVLFGDIYCRRVDKLNQYTATDSALSPSHSETKPLLDIFSNMYSNDVWSGGSGPGSRLENIGPYHSCLQDLLRQHNIKSIVDIGCGDWQSTQYLDLAGISYTGVDIVPSVIEGNRKAHSKADVTFVCGNFSEINLPPADLVICKDVLQHLPNKSVYDFLRQLHNFRYALITNDIGDNIGRDAKLVSNPYHFARLDITRAPFFLHAKRVCEVMGGKVTHFVADTQQYLNRQSHSTLSRPSDAEQAPLPAVHPQKLQTKFLTGAGHPPKVLIAILAKQKEPMLSLYLRCIEALDYSKSAIALYIRTNNNTDRTADILRDWVKRVGAEYASVEFDDADVPIQVQQYGVHEWNAPRFKVLGEIRQASLDKALDAACDFYFVVDVDNFIRPGTLRELVSLNLPIVGPLLRHEAPENPYSNYHYSVDANGYYIDSEEYFWLLNQRIRGLVEVEVIHCTYLIRCDCIPALRYDDGSQRHEYVIFSASARAANIPQYLDTREVYGYLTLDENARLCELLMGKEIDIALKQSK